MLPLLVSTLLPTAPGSLVTGAVGHAVVTRGALIRMSAALHSATHECAKARKSTLSWLFPEVAASSVQYEQLTRSTEGKTEGRKRRDRNFEVKRQPTPEILLKVQLVKHQKSWGGPDPHRAAQIEAGQGRHGRCGWVDAGQGSGQLRVSHGGSDNPAGPGAAVDLCVFGEVVAAGKLLLTQWALVRLDARVRAAVTRQFIGAGEPGDTRTEGWCYPQLEGGLETHQLTYPLIGTYQIPSSQWWIRLHKLILDLLYESNPFSCFAVKDEIFVELLPADLLCGRYSKGSGTSGAKRADWSNVFVLL